MTFSIKNSQETVDLVTYTEETLNEKLHFLCGDGQIVTLDILFQTYNILQYIPKP